MSVIRMLGVDMSTFTHAHGWRAGALASEFVRWVPALTVALACSGSSYSEHQLSGRVLTDSDSLAIPVLILAVADFLIVADLAADHPIHIIDASDGRLRSIFRRGGGPGEVKAPWTLFRDRGGLVYGIPRSCESPAWIHGVL